MCHFGIVLTSHPHRVKIATLPVNTQIVKYSPDTPLYAYEWSLVPSAVPSLASQLTHFAHTQHSGIQLHAHRFITLY